MFYVTLVNLNIELEVWFGTKSHFQRIEACMDGEAKDSSRSPDDLMKQTDFRLCL